MWSGLTAVRGCASGIEDGPEAVHGGHNPVVSPTNACPRPLMPGDPLPHERRGTCRHVRRFGSGRGARPLGPTTPPPHFETGRPHSDRPPPPPKHTGPPLQQQQCTQVHQTEEGAGHVCAGAPWLYHVALTSVCLCGGLAPLCGVCAERLDPWCSGLPLQEVSDVSETSHRRCPLMERDDSVEPRL